jgi:hypothetical protein
MTGFIDVSERNNYRINGIELYLTIGYHQNKNLVFEYNLAVSRSQNVFK